MPFISLLYCKTAFSKVTYDVVGHIYLTYSERLSGMKLQVSLHVVFYNLFKKLWVQH
jgi:hypothetical protein